MSQIAIIGGSGIYNLETLNLVEEHLIATPFGETSDKISEFEVDGCNFYFIPRHGKGHIYNPSEINYRANIYALKKLGVTSVISISAVGSLNEKIEPTKLVLPDQFIDWTKGKRARTFFKEGIVGHVSVAEPIDSNLKNRLNDILKNKSINYQNGGTYICIEGPQFSTRAESLLYKTFGADIIGMTNLPEAFLAKEAAIAYATIAMVTDFDAWKPEFCTLEEIMKVMKTNTEQVEKLIPSLVKNLSKNPIVPNKVNSNSIVTNDQFLTLEQQEVIETLLR